MNLAERLIAGRKRLDKGHCSICNGIREDMQIQRKVGCCRTCEQNNFSFLSDDEIFDLKVQFVQVNRRNKEDSKNVLIYQNDILIGELQLFRDRWIAHDLSSHPRRNIRGMFVSTDYALRTLLIAIHQRKKG